MNTAEFDQTLAETNEGLDSFVEQYRMLDSEHGEVANVTMLADALTDVPLPALAALLATAIRRLASRSEEQP